MAHPPNAELVAVHFLRTIADLPSGVATTVPDRTDAGFAADGFVQVVATLGGSPHLYTGRQNSVLQVDAWAFTDGSRSAPWGKAASLLAYVKQAVDGKDVSGTVTTPAAFQNARLMSAAIQRDPIRVPDDEGGMAHYTMDLQLWWVPINEGG